MQEISRKLLAFRQQGLTKNFKPLAPCTHADQCPMLLHSKKDWCFDRTSIAIPELAKNLYKILPFETKHLTYSYTLLSQKKAQGQNEDKIQNNGIEDLKQVNSEGRIVGDWQQEKGKRKVMMCRSSEREFISLLKKSSSKSITGFSRGDKISLDFDYEIKGNELRLK
jgi:ribosomal protein RSM22 (predicted rRNA methylase)